MDDSFSELKKIIADEKRILEDMKKNPQDQSLISELRKNNDEIPKIIESLNLTGKLPSMRGSAGISAKSETSQNMPAEQEKKADTFAKIKEAEKEVKKGKMEKADKEALKLQEDVIKRLKRGKRKKEVIKERKPNPYVKISNSFFSKFSLSLYKNETFNSLKKDLIQANLTYLPVSYISTMLFTTLIAFFAGILVMIFFMFFNIVIKPPFLAMYDGDIIVRFIKVFWIMLAAPVATFLIMFFYPAVERNFIKDKINQELPFVTIHMAAIAGSMVEPSKIFEIITVTKEYPYTSKEFTKIINDINIYGYNLVGALRETAMNTASNKLGEMLNGVATTITSGGDIQMYFEKKSQSLLFDYRLQRERYTRMAETFMDIYISVVIAAPMILMLLLMMIKISGLGISLSTQTLTVIIVGGVAIVNVIFITFLYLKQPES
jgi:flagellar protein FlaJ